MDSSVLRRSIAVILILHFAIGSYGAVNLIFERSTLSNEITLICRSSVNYQPVSSADFWLNTTAMPLTSLLALSDYTVPDVGRFQFTITQDLEGEFFCGHIGTSTSNSKVLISYPHPDANTLTYHAIPVGDSVAIPCAIKPGALKQHYTVQWMNGEELLTSNRYRLADDFTVTINSVEMNDDGDRYHCVVAIDNPQVSGTADYYVTGPQTTLHVYDIPHITSSPEDRVLLDSEATDVMFTCSAKGVPTVTITWLYNGQDVREREDSGRFQVEMIPSATDNIITSLLVIKQIKVVDGGTYVCWAHNTVDTGEENVQFSDTESATLSILTNNIVFNTGITTEGDLILRLLLPAPIEEPLSLVLRFTSVTTGATREVEIKDNFMNTDTINHQVENAMVPFTEFRVQVAMKIRGVRGMFTPASQELNTGVPVTLPPETASQSPSECAVSETTIIIASAAIGGGLVAIALLVISATVFCKIFNFFTREAQIDKLLRQVERYKDDPETKARFLDILVKRMDRDSDERESQGSRENSEPPRAPVTIQNHNSVPHSNRNVVISIDFPDSEEPLPPPPYPDHTPDDKSSMAETQLDISSGVNIPKQPEGDHERTSDAAEPYLETAEKND